MAHLALKQRRMERSKMFGTYVKVLSPNSLSNIPNRINTVYADKIEEGKRKRFHFVDVSDAHDTHTLRKIQISQLSLC